MEQSTLLLDKETEKELDKEIGETIDLDLKDLKDAKDAEPEDQEISDFSIQMEAGEKVIFLDKRQFGGDAIQQSTWEQAIKHALMDLDIAQEWKIEWVTLPAGDTFVAVGMEENKVQGIAITEEKWNANDLRSSISDGRLFSDNGEIARISQVNVKDHQNIFAYYEDSENMGAVLGIYRDYGILLYQITSMKKYSAFLARIAKRWDHVPSKKGAVLKKKNVALEQRSKNFLAYLFTDSIAEQLLAKFGNPIAALDPLKGLTFTPKGNAKIPSEYKGITGLGAKRIAQAYAILYNIENQGDQAE